MQPKVSILIPLFNAEQYITETINSILEQSYLHIEIIVVDDNSTDQSYEIVKNIVSEKIILIKNNSKGACSARNLAFELSSGDYIQYLDADDVLDSKKIAVQLEALRKCDSDTVAFGVWGRFSDHIQQVIWESGKTNQSYDRPVHLLADCWLHHEMVPVHSWLTPRGLIVKAGPWNEQLHHNQDGEFFSRVIANATQVIHCQEAKVYYRSNLQGSISDRSGSEKHATSQLLSYQHYTYNLKAFLGDRLLKKALATNFLNFIYLFNDKYPELVAKAEAEFHNLGFEKMWAVGGKKFKTMAGIIGFKNALKLRKIIS